MPTAPPTSEARARRLGVVAPTTTAEGLALLTAAVLVASNIAGTVVFLANLRRVLASQIPREMTLPAKKEATQVSPAGTLRIIVQADGSLMIDGSPVALESLAALVRARSPERVILQAAPEVPYPRIKAILPEIGRAGVKSVTFTVPTPKATTVY